MTIPTLSSVRRVPISVLFLSSMTLRRAVVVVLRFPLSLVFALLFDIVFFFKLSFRLLAKLDLWHGIGVLEVLFGFQVFFKIFYELRKTREALAVENKPIGFNFDDLVFDGQPL